MGVRRAEAGEIAANPGHTERIDQLRSALNRKARIAIASFGLALPVTVCVCVWTGPTGRSSSASRRRGRRASCWGDLGVVRAAVWWPAVVVPGPYLYPQVGGCVRPSYRSGGRTLGGCFLRTG